MTDTNTHTPTDADIIALADETRTGEPGREGYILPISFARAVLAKWGTPAPVSQPVATPSGPLTDSQIADIYFEALGSQHLREQDRKMVARFACAVEAEVQKQDEALIRQLVEALDGAIAITMGKIDLRNVAIAAARERLESKPRQ